MIVGYRDMASDGVRAEAFSRNRRMYLANAENRVYNSLVGALLARAFFLRFRTLREALLRAGEDAREYDRRPKL